LVDNAELSDYGGRSLSVKKSFSEFFKIDLNSEEANNKRIKELNKWWYSTGKNLEDNKSLSINSQLQKRKFIDENDQLVRMDAKNLNINNKYKKIYLVICKNN